jgi:hypothetical protein
VTQDVNEHTGGVSISAQAVMQAAQQRLSMQLQELLELTARNVDLEQEVAQQRRRIEHLEGLLPMPGQPDAPKLPQQQRTEG